MWWATVGGRGPHGSCLQPSSGYGEEWFWLGAKWWAAINARHTSQRCELIAAAAAHSTALVHCADDDDVLLKPQTSRQLFRVSRSIYQSRPPRVHSFEPLSVSQAAHSWSSGGPKPRPLMSVWGQLHGMSDSVSLVMLSG